LTDERANETRLGGTNGFSASRGIPRHVCNSMFYYHLDKKTAADPFAVTLRQSATQKNMSVSGSLSVSTTRSYGEFWAPRPNTKSYNITGCLRPWILFAGPPFPPQYLQVFFFICTFILWPHKSEQWVDPLRIFHDSPCSIRTCISPHACSRFVRRKCLVVITGWPCYGRTLGARGAWAMNTIHSVGRLALSSPLSMRPLCVASL